MKTIELANHKGTLAYDEVGSGLPIVLLHGFPFDHTMWSPQLEAIAAAGFRVLAPDFPRFGQSPAFGEPFTIDGAGHLIADWLSALSIERAVIAGLSMGGYVAMAFARQHRQRLAGLILADTKSAPDDAAGREGRDKAIAKVQVDGPAAFSESMVGKLISPKANQGVFDLAKSIMLRQNAEAITTALMALRDRPDATPGLAAITVPTLVIVGEEDAVTPPAAAKALSANIATSELVRIADAGHLSNIEQPEEFNRAVIAFLKKMQ